MKLLVTIAIVTALACAAAAQKSGDVLATATGHVWKTSDLSAQLQQEISEIPAKTITGRKALLDQMLSQRLLQTEATSRGISRGQLIALEKAKVADPAADEIERVLAANRDQLADLTPEQARHRVVAFLRNKPEQEALTAMLAQLRTKYKASAGKDVNAPNLLPGDIVGTVSGRPITAREFEAYAKVPMSEARAELGDAIAEELTDIVYTALVGDEARSLGVDAGTVIAREVTDKMKDYSDAERTALETAFTKRLFTKYQVKILYRPPAAAAQVISVDDDPATGPATAPVTIVMFTDFQCPACSAAHPVLKGVMASYPGKIRFVVRDYPLESIHENAFNAARAVNAARAQGKFTEYAELVYTRQDSLDVASLKRYAAEIGLSATQFDIDFNSEKTAAEIRKDMDDGDTYGITGTPTIFVNGLRVRNISADGFSAAIERALRVR